METLLAALLALGTFLAGAGTAMLVVDLDEIESGVRRTVTTEAVLVFSLGVSVATSSIFAAVI